MDNRHSLSGSQLSGHGSHEREVTGASETSSVSAVSFDDELKKVSIKSLEGDFQLIPIMLYDFQLLWRVDQAIEESSRALTSKAPCDEIAFDTYQSETDKTDSIGYSDTTNDIEVSRGKRRVSSLSQIFDRGSKSGNDFLSSDPLKSQPISVIKPASSFKDPTAASNPELDDYLQSHRQEEKDVSTSMEATAPVQGSTLGWEEDDIDIKVEVGVDENDNMLTVKQRPTLFANIPSEDELEGSNSSSVSKSNPDIDQRDDSQKQKRSNVSTKSSQSFTFSAQQKALGKASLYSHKPSKNGSKPNQGFICDPQKMNAPRISRPV